MKLVPFDALKPTVQAEARRLYPVNDPGLWLYRVTGRGKLARRNTLVYNRPAAPVVEYEQWSLPDLG